MNERIEERDLSLLFDVSRASSEPTLDRYIEGILPACVNWFNASGLSVFIRQEDGEEFLLASKTGSDTTVPDGAKLRSGHGIAGACISTGQPMIVQDPLDNPMLIGKVRPRDDIGSSMVVPLVTPESGCIGVLNVSRRIGEPSFSNADLRQAVPLARHIAMAISNARLFASVNHAISETRAANEKLDAIIACLGVGVVVTDSFGAVEQWNPEANAILGIPLMAGTQLAQALSRLPDSLKAVAVRGLRKACSGKRFVERAHDEASDRAWSIVASPLPRGGATLVIQDVSNHEKALKELDRVKRLAEIGQLTAAIAHEIRNPLTGIRSAAQIVQSAPGELAEFGRIIEREALKLNSLCDDFLDFARPLTLHMEKLDLVDVLRRVCAEYEDMASRSKVNLRLMMDSRAACVKGDLMRVEQVCRNLVLNALQASAPGGNVDVHLLQGKLVVEDQGRGIENEVVEKLFTPFFTTKADGTGLGLSNVRKIVDAHGWQIKVTSHPGSGTRFEVLFQDQRVA
jgi:nitrogen-specific signal transduction histidine kinase